MHLVGTVIDTRLTRVTVHERQGSIVGQALGTEDLNGSIDDVVNHLRADHLNEADIHAGDYNIHWLENYLKES